MTLFNTERKTKTISINNLHIATPISNSPLCMATHKFLQVDNNAVLVAFVCQILERKKTFRNTKLPEAEQDLEIEGTILESPKFRSNWVKRYTIIKIV